MARPAVIAAFTLASTVLPTVGSATEARAPASAVIVDATGVRMNWTMAMPSVQAGASGASFIGAMPSMGMAMMLMPRNSGLLVRREDATGAPVTAPASFEVTRDPGSDVLTVRTGRDMDLRVAADDAIAGGALIGGAAASIAVDRGVTMSVNDRLAAPVASDTVTIVVQYN